MKEEHQLPSVAIVGRPNVGKSALFNRLIGRRTAIVHDQPGVTRDRLSATCDAGPVPFTLWDTGGIGGRGAAAKNILPATFDRHCGSAECRKIFTRKRHHSE